MMANTITHAMRTSRRFVAYALLIVVSALPSGFRTSLGMAEQRWETYSDQRFGFQIDYPMGWYISPRDDSASKIGETLSFSNLPIPTEAEQYAGIENRVVVTVGFYLAEIQAGQPIDQWATQYEERAQIEDPGQIKITENFSTMTSQRNSWRLGGTGELGAFHVVMIPVEKIVWFVWSNAEKQNLGIYNHMVASFNAGNRPPKSLNAVYGNDFKPMSITTSSKLTNRNVAHLPEQAGVARYHLASLALGTDPSGYRLPFTGQKTITQGPGCGATHIGRSSEAIDYSMTSGTAVKATYAGVSSFVGWNNNGFGNLINIDHGPSPVKRSYYAHLQSFAISGVGVSVSKGQIIGYSDNTGNSTGPHLHFEVRDVSSNYSIWIRTLPTTVWYSGNANSPCTGSGDDYDGYATGP